MLLARQLDTTWERWSCESCAKLTRADNPNLGAASEYLVAQAAENKRVNAREAGLQKARAGKKPTRLARLAGQR